MGGSSKANEESHNPGKPGLSPRVVRLPETHENSNYILLQIPVEISNSVRGEKALSVAENLLNSSLPLSPAAIARLQGVRLIHRPRPAKVK